MDGLTRAQIRATTLAALQASTALTAIIPADHIFDSRLTPTVYADGATITVWTDGQRGQPIGMASAGYQVWGVDTDVVCELRAPGTAGTEETMADVADTMIAALLESAAWIAQADNGPPVWTVSEPFRSNDGDRPWVGIHLLVTLSHLRAYATS